MGFEQQQKAEAGQATSDTRLDGVDAVPAGDRLRSQEGQARELIQAAARGEGELEREGQDTPPTDVSGMRDALSYGIFDWAITDSEARRVIDELAGLDQAGLRSAVEQLGDTFIDRLIDNLSAADALTNQSLLERIRLYRHGTHPDMLAADKTGGVTETDLEDTSALFVDGISPDDVIQANLNDCYFVSVLGSLAGQDPSFIEGMIQDQGGGRYAVRFFHQSTAGGPYEPVWVAVDSTLPASGGTPHYGRSDDVDADGRRELWPSIAEKAYAKFKGDYADIDWGNTIYAYQAIFGRDGTRTNTNTTADAEWTTLTTALDAAEAVVASTGSHVISVLGYADDGTNRTVDVRDQAQAGGGADGRETITFAVFRTRFTYFRHTGTTVQMEDDTP